MKKLFIPLYRKLLLDNHLKHELDKTKSLDLDIAYSIQYKKLAEQIREYLGKGRLIQLLGCSEIKSDNLLLISDGEFHATNPASKVIYLLNMLTGKLSRQENMKNKGKYLRFLVSDNIGILVSIKQGQNNIKEAIRLKGRLKRKGKNAYILIGDNITGLEDFDFDSYINTACPRLDFLYYQEVPV